MLLRQEAKGKSEKLLVKASTQQQMSSLQQELAAAKKQLGARTMQSMKCSRGCKSNPRPLWLSAVCQQRLSRGGW